MQTRKKILVKGIVQAVGFRPFIYNLAKKFGLGGYVANTGKGVVIEAQGCGENIRNFISAIKQNPPEISKIESIKITNAALKKDSSFIIKPSRNEAAQTLVPADIAICKDCAKDIADPGGRRYRYPFTNCTACGPRYTIIKKLPYDRAQTTMGAFKMCPACRAEFENPADRRFHAQPNCCPVCGPQVEFIYNGKKTGGLEETAAKIRQGKIIAIKSLGGFHLACDALNKAAVARLRRLKNRPHKPLALMFGDIKNIKKYCRVNRVEEALLKSKQAPIVMLRKRVNIPLISDGLPATGAMLPYTPLHKIIFDILGGGPLVMTSGNIAGQPICIDNGEAQRKLANIADGFLLHNRPIYNRMDDSVLFELRGKTYFLRRARGYTPGFIKLQKPLKKPVLALGANLTNTFCLGKGDKIFTSQYIGDLDKYENTLYFKETLAKMQKLLNIRPQVFVRDMHPDYYGAHFKPGAKAVQHHLAHALAVAAEHAPGGPFLCFAFDGAGLGADGAIWGAEFLVIDKNKWRRAGCFKPVKITGGDSAARDIWKCAVSYMTAAGIGTGDIKKILRGVSARDIGTAAGALKNNINCYAYTGAGRLFDAAAAILGLCSRATYDAHGALMLEGAAARAPKAAAHYPFTIAEDNDFITIDTAPIIKGLAADRRAGAAPKAAAKFHETLARIILAVARRINIKTVVLAGGVFQNKILLENVLAKLMKAGFKVYAGNALPPGDGAVAAGQLYAVYKNFV